jgi:hypothetical protein
VTEAEDRAASGAAEPAAPGDLAAAGEPAGNADASGKEPSEDRSTLATVASTIADAATPVVAAVEQIAGVARRRLAGTSGARIRRVRRMAKEPLSNLWEVHPEARRATFRELAPRVVPVEQIVGTAVEGPPQRGGDFLPLRDRRSTDWRARWQRILQGVDQMVNLPPVDLIKFGDEYWVIDGHNRVAAALYTGQIGVDANVLEARMPGVSAEPTKGNLAPYLENSLELRQAGAGRFVRGTVVPEPLPPSVTGAEEE